MNNQPRRTYSRIATAIVIVAVVLAGGMYVATYVGTSSTVQSASGTCLKEVPQSAVFSYYSNSTSQGVSVTYSNGTKEFSPVNSCPVPVTPENYKVDSIIEASPKFIAAENGFTYEATNACNCSWGGSSSNSTGQYAILNFILYGNQKIYPCGPSSYWTFNQLGLILVTIPINSTGGLQYSRAEIQAGPGNNIFHCSTTQTATYTTTATVTTALAQPCSEQVYNSGSTLTMANVPVLLMQPNSTAYICVTYESSWRGNSSQYRSQYFPNGTYQFSLSISKEHCVTTSTETACSSTISNSFIISASPSSIQPSATTDYVTVVYTVRALTNSTGFYDHSAPYYYCSGMPMAVGFSASQVNSSDFAPILIPPCPLLPFAPISVSVGGVQVTYIAFGSKS